MAARKNTRVRRKPASKARDPRSQSPSFASNRLEALLNRFSCAIAIFATAVDALAHSDDPGKTSVSDSGERASTIDHGVRILRQIDDELEGVLREMFR
jgi:hypothetical protein